MKLSFFFIANKTHEIDDEDELILSEEEIVSPVQIDYSSMFIFEKDNPIRAACHALNTSTGFRNEWKI